MEGQGGGLLPPVREAGGAQLLPGGAGEVGGCKGGGQARVRGLGVDAACDLLGGLGRARPGTGPVPPSDRRRDAPDAVVLPLPAVQDVTGELGAQAPSRTSPSASTAGVQAEAGTFGTCWWITSVIAIPTE